MIEQNLITKSQMETNKNFQKLEKFNETIKEITEVEFELIGLS